MSSCLLPVSLSFQPLTPLVSPFFSSSRAHWDAVGPCSLHIDWCPCAQQQRIVWRFSPLVVDPTQPKTRAARICCRQWLWPLLCSDCRDSLLSALNTTLWQDQQCVLAKQWWHNVSASVFWLLTCRESALHCHFYFRKLMWHLVRISLQWQLCFRTKELSGCI